jgi:aldehyde:ferredoxin oxidoreductase
MLHEVSRLVGFWVMHQADPASSPVSNEVFRAAAERFWQHPAAWDLTTSAGKAQAAAIIMDRTLVKDSLTLCDSAWPLMVSWHTRDRVGDPTLESRIFAAVTGMDLAEEDLNRYGERIFNLQRAILLREGRRPKEDDTLASFNFNDPVQSVFMNPEVIVPGPGDAVVSKKGATLDPGAFQVMREEFYRLRGWEAATGCQCSALFEALDLSDVADAMAALGYLED